MSRPVTSPDDISKEQFSQLLGQYDSLIQTLSGSTTSKPGTRTLQELDQFRYEEAVAAFSSSKPTRQMTHDDVKTLVEWKLRHGKFRPTLMSLVSSNASANVANTIQSALAQYWKTKDADAALKTISSLKGVGPATAALLLSVHDPEDVIFFSDEAFWWLCCGGQKRPIKYSPKEYQALRGAARVLSKRLEVGATDIEKVAYVLFKGEVAPESGPVADKRPKPSAGKTQPRAATKTAEAAPETGTKRKPANGGDEHASTGVRRSKRGKT
ncbi:uncharacterized protein B0I36DRAFT_142486 [Microdochium trichocladiopsis]|uniref:Uncharacterized protein n=1 Tax=Microdochium trichocladiopsis TaxID=1682393 RepID=A0A9P9BNR9_9PEZI|nr:uncharacterized protein B0I36DRAFT_142486 [Microdochium trichocladiopsis]KAH7027729.1 hypothetical protein B0I36DRAFT_142486 [Microdochium trichocladiopsis]